MNGRLVGRDPEQLVWSAASLHSSNSPPPATVRDRLSALVDDVARTHDTVTITRNGVPAAVVLSVDDYESIMETLALVTDPDDRARIEEGESSIAAGDITSGEEMARLIAQRVRRDAGAE